jgi:polysaccharide export outer membrane protein
MIRILKYFSVILALSAGFAHAADAYRIRSGDVLEVSVWQDPKLNRQVVVAPDGVVAVPLAGRFKVSGLTVSAAESLLKSRLQPKYKEDLDVTVLYIMSPKKDVLPPVAKEPPKIPEYTIYVTGEVAKPGAFVVPKKPPTVLQAIALSGGVGPFAAERRIQIHRKSHGGEMVYSFNYSLYTRGDNMEGNITLQNGDVVVVPERGLFE